LPDRFSVRAEREYLVLEGESGDWQEIVKANFLLTKSLSKAII